MNSFIDQIIQTKKVYALKVEEGYAMSLSNYFTDEEDDQMELFCFWSDPELAKSHIQNEWADYKLDELSLSDFLEDWCIAMSDENYVAGLNFSTEMSGIEVDTLELLIEICQKLKENNTEISFKKFNNLANLHHEAKKALKYE
jgi:hypothetical protein